MLLANVMKSAKKAFVNCKIFCTPMYLFIHIKSIVLLVGTYPPIYRNIVELNRQSCPGALLSEGR